MTKKHSGSLGPDFAKVLRQYEICERGAVQAKAGKTEIELPDLYLGELAHALAADAVLRKQDETGTETLDPDSALFGYREYLMPLVQMLATDARTLRSSFKFRASWHALHTLADHPPEETRLPFDHCVLVVDQMPTMHSSTRWPDGTEVVGLRRLKPPLSLVLFIERRLRIEDNVGPWYDEAGIGIGSEFLSITPWINAEVVPCEYHITPDRPWNDMEWTIAALPGTSEKGTNELLQFAQYVLVPFGTWLSALDHPSAKLIDTQGLRPGIKYKAPKKPGQRRMYEHKMIVIDPTRPVLLTENGGPSGKRHRLHPVRGFYRTYKKSGKKVWVRPHWRGDEKLGVITHDYKITTEETEDDDDGDK